MKLAAVRLFRIGQSRSRLLGSPDKLPAVDGPVAKSSTRDSVNWLAAHEACFLAETGEKHSGSVTPCLHYRYERLISRGAEKVCRPLPTENAARMTDPKETFTLSQLPFRSFWASD